MKVALFIDSLALGGAQKHVVQLVTGFAPEGWKFTVYVLNDRVESVYRDKLEAAGAQVVVVGRRAVLTGLGWWRCAREVRRDRTRLIITCLFVSTLFGRLVSRTFDRIPVLTLLQARNLDHAPWQLMLTRITADWTDLIASNSASAAAFACRHEGADPSQCHLVPNAVDPPMPLGLVDWGQAGLPELVGKRVIGSFGRLHVQKGYDQLLFAIRSVVRRFPEVRLVVWGEGPERSHLERLSGLLELSNSVHFPGARPDSGRFLGLLEVYVQPSRFEGTPNGVMEAMVAGVPVVATAVDGVPGLFASEMRSYLVPSEDPEALGKALIRVLGTTASARAQAVAQQRAISERFSIARLVAAYRTLIYKLGLRFPAAVISMAQSLHAPHRTL